MKVERDEHVRGVCVEMRVFVIHSNSTVTHTHTPHTQSTKCAYIRRGRDGNLRKKSGFLVRLPGHGGAGGSGFRFLSESRRCGGERVLRRAIGKNKLKTLLKTAQKGAHWGTQRNIYLAASVRVRVGSANREGILIACDMYFSSAESMLGAESRGDTHSSAWVTTGGIVACSSWPATPATIAY